MLGVCLKSNPAFERALARFLKMQAKVKSKKKG